MNRGKTGEKNAGLLLLPALLLINAFNLFLIFQIIDHGSRLVVLQRNRPSRIHQIEEAQSEIAQARTAQTVLESLAHDLLVLEATDPDIRRLVDKYQIRQN